MSFRGFFRSVSSRVKGFDLVQMSVTDNGSALKRKDNNNTIFFVSADEVC